MHIFCVLCISEDDLNSCRFEMGEVGVEWVLAVVSVCVCMCVCALGCMSVFLYVCVYKNTACVYLCDGVCLCLCLYVCMWVYLLKCVLVVCIMHEAVFLCVYVCVFGCVSVYV